LIGRIIAESDFFEPLKPGSYITPGFGGCVYFPTGKGFIVLRIMPKSTSPACKDNFGKDPPNATLSVYEPGQPDNTVVVVEIANPIVNGREAQQDHTYNRPAEAFARGQDETRSGNAQQQRERVIKKVVALKNQQPNYQSKKGEDNEKEDTVYGNRIGNGFVEHGSVFLCDGPAVQV
jgi:hypothetical protein